jgi:hypothetical protein
LQADHIPEVSLVGLSFADSIRPIDIQFVEVALYFFV